MEMNGETRNRLGTRAFAEIINYNPELLFNKVIFVLYIFVNKIF